MLTQNFYFVDVSQHFQTYLYLHYIYPPYQIFFEVGQFHDLSICMYLLSLFCKFHYPNPNFPLKYPLKLHLSKCSFFVSINAISLIRATLLILYNFCKASIPLEFQENRRRLFHFSQNSYKISLYSFLLMLTLKYP